MKKHTKFALSISAILFGVFALSSCTQSFCTIDDQAHMLYAMDNGVTKYYGEEVSGSAALEGFTGIYYTTEIKEKSYIETVNTNALKSEFKVPSIKYWHFLDVEVLKLALKTDAGHDVDTTTVSYEKIVEVLDQYGYVKFTDLRTDVKRSKLKVFYEWNTLNENTHQSVDIDECATADYVKLYQQTMTKAISGYRSCIAIKDGYYGYYGINGEKTTVFIEGKSWGYAWSKGLFEGLLVYPIAWLVDTFCSLMLNGGVMAGLAQLLSILIVTFIVRSLMLVATIKQSASTAKMQALSPEIAKIQQKYPNANTNQYEKQALAQETQKLYKKHGINPFTSFIVMLVQFPVFICVWGALQGSAYLSTGSFLGLHLSDSISSVLFTWSNWSNPASGVWTALALFLLMAISQVGAMLLPQIIQKRNNKNVAKLGKNPNADKQNNTMKLFTYGMMVMIIIMGFSLASAMGVYWFVGALFSIGQTLVMQAINKKKMKQ